MKNIAIVGCGGMVSAEMEEVMAVAAETHIVVEFED